MPIDPVSAFLSSVAIGQCHRADASHGATLTRVGDVIRGRLKVHPEKLLEEARRLEIDGTEEAFGKSLTRLGHRVNGLEVAATLATRSALELGALRNELRDAIEYYGRLRSGSGDDDDLVAAVAMNQRSNRRGLLAFDQIPIQDLFVVPKLIEPGTRVRFPADFLAGVDDEPILIQAPFGFGKSTLLRMLATGRLSADTWLPSNEIRPALPIYLTAGRLLRESGQGGVTRAIEASLREQSGIDVAGLLTRGRSSAALILLVDSFDECPDEKEAVKLFHELMQLARDRSDLRVVLAGRSRFFDLPDTRRILRLRPYPPFQLCGLDGVAREQWRTKWNVFAGTRGWPELSTRAIESDDGAPLEVFSAPIFLVLRGILEDGRTRPWTRSGLTAEFIDKTIAGKVIEESPGKVSGSLDPELVEPLAALEVKSKRRLLQETALLCATLGQDRRISLTVLGEELPKRLPTECERLTASMKSDGGVSADGLIDWMRGLALAHVFDQAEGELEFAFQMFLDFLIAERFVNLAIANDQASIDWSGHIQTQDQISIAIELLERVEGSPTWRILDQLIPFEESRFGAVDSGSIAAVLARGSLAGIQRTLALSTHSKDPDHAAKVERAISQRSRMKVGTLGMGEIPTLERVVLEDGVVPHGTGSMRLVGTELELRRIDFIPSPKRHVRPGPINGRDAGITCIRSRAFDLAFRGGSFTISLRECRMTTCVFTESILRIEIPQDAQETLIERSTFKGCRIRLDGGSLRLLDCELVDCVFEGDLTGVSFVQCQLVGTAIDTAVDVSPAEPLEVSERTIEANRGKVRSLTRTDTNTGVFLETSRSRYDRLERTVEHLAERLPYLEESLHFLTAKWRMPRAEAIRVLSPLGLESWRSDQDVDPPVDGSLPDGGLSVSRDEPDRKRVGLEEGGRPAHVKSRSAVNAPDDLSPEGEVADSGGVRMVQSNASKLARTIQRERHRLQRLRDELLTARARDLRADGSVWWDEES